MSLYTMCHWPHRMQVAQKILMTVLSEVQEHHAEHWRRVTVIIIIITVAFTHTSAALSHLLFIFNIH